MRSNVMEWGARNDTVMEAEAFAIPTHGTSANRGGHPRRLDTQLTQPLLILRPCAERCVVCSVCSTMMFLPPPHAYQGNSSRRAWRSACVTWSVRVLRVVRVLHVFKTLHGTPLATKARLRLEKLR